MKKGIGVGLLLVSSVLGENRGTSQTSQSSLYSPTIYRISQVIVITGTTLDLHSSRGGYELNPILGRGRVGGRQIGIKIGITGGVLGTQEYLVRKDGKKRKIATIVNFVLGGVLGGVAVRNYKVR